jgi:hypothetical protein
MRLQLQNAGEKLTGLSAFYLNLPVLENLSDRL